MSLVESLRADQRRRQMEAAQAYTAQLARLGSVDRYRQLLAGDGDADALVALRSVMAELCLSPADVEADAAALAAHATATAAVLTPDGRAALDAESAADVEAVRAEVRDALAAWLALQPDFAMADAAREFYLFTLRNLSAGGESDRATALDRSTEWEQRIGDAANRRNRATARSEQAQAELARLAAAHPRVLGSPSAAAGLDVPPDPLPSRVKRSPAEFQRAAAVA